MMRALVLAALFPLAASCQIELLLFDGTNTTPVGSSLDVGSIPVGDTLETRFEVLNTGATSVNIATLSIAGSGFSFEAVPSLPYILAPGANVGFSTSFSGSLPASYSANLTINTLTVVLRATVTTASQAATVYVDGATTPLAAGSTITFGSVQTGSSASHSIEIENPAGANPVTISLSGADFQAPTAPTQVAAGATASFQLSFLPTSGRAFQGTLTVGPNSFTLTGQGITPAVPTASILVNDGAAVTSSQQVNVTIPLSAASQAIATGTLTLQFESSVSGASSDSAIQFLSGSALTASVNIAPGDTTASINGNPSIALQTGTTAGSIVLTLQLGTSGSQVSIPIAPAPVNIGSSSGIVGPSELTISLTGFDNTHSVSQLAFTFYDTNNNTVSPGTITYNAASLFSNYFAGGQYGGMFALNAMFPVTGNETLISTAEVAITNSAGVIQTQRIIF